MIPVFLKKLFGAEAKAAAPVAHHPHIELLIKEAESTGDDSRLTAETILKWAWDKHDKKLNIAAPQEFIDHLKGSAYKPSSDLTPEEKTGLSARKALICDALESIKTSGHLESQIGHRLRALSETGQVPPPTPQARAPRQNI